MSGPDAKAYRIRSVNGEEMWATPALVNGTPGWRSVAGDNVFWGRLYVATISPSSGADTASAGKTSGSPSGSGDPSPRPDDGDHSYSDGWKP